MRCQLLHWRLRSMTLCIYISSTGKQLHRIRYSRMAKDFRYYFQHPWSRLVVAYLVIFFNFLIFAEDPVSHSQTEANVIVVGNCFSFVSNKYPEGGGWRFLKVFLWLLAILTGLIAGKFLFHQRLFGKFSNSLDDLLLMLAPYGFFFYKFLTLATKTGYNNNNTVQNERSHITEYRHVEINVCLC